ncbi:hypothetical protein BCR33DRAFT_717396 [Rhizoclosmatium globosum]|uniref:PARP-type domain-containing protein n=1 Tax=Rhizoclosmatium globosum TaxID=329046 RepID=A0A1Y2CA23_9FUNG|nr:hypothetical protein BCR33DRAFT_717396 [Rhizoclosmatium globosum]|eukprot:ORY43747.1 hypothetical protein BCR33DRAFT_717396 [Rhizoclosmatium globosum]
MTQYKIEGAKSGRGACRKCKTVIALNAPRFGSWDKDKSHGTVYWNCIGCVTQVQLTKALASCPGGINQIQGLAAFPDDVKLTIVATLQATHDRPVPEPKSTPKRKKTSRPRRTKSREGEVEVESKSEDKVDIKEVDASIEDKDESNKKAKIDESKNENEE